jgi:HSP20 family protein
MRDRTFRWNPFRSMMRGPLGDELEHLMRRAFDRDEGWAPHADLVETPDAFVVRIDAPGVTADDVHVTLTGATLALRGERKAEARREQDHWHLAERQHGTFQRTLELPAAVDAGGVDSDGVDAVLKDGVLTVTVRKAPAAKSSRIKVASG